MEWGNKLHSFHGRKERQVKKFHKIALGGLLAILVTVAVVAVAPAHDKNGKSGLKAFLSGYQEVPANSTTGVGKFKARLNGATIEFKLRYTGLEAPVKFAHIHFGQRDVNGGVAAFLCGGGGKPACPNSGEVTGTIAASDVVGPADQGIAPGEFDELVNAIKHGVTYVNVHTDKFPNGEIRGQIGGGRDWHGFKKHGHKRGGEHHGFHKGGGHDND
jgi:CHRD domain